MERLANRIVDLDRYRRRFRGLYSPPKLDFAVASDGTKIYNFQELNIEEVLEHTPQHQRIQHDWDACHRDTYYQPTCPDLAKRAYCPLELSAFLDIAHRSYHFTERDKAMLFSPIPKATTHEELFDLLNSWLKLLSSWIFGGSLSHVRLVLIPQDAKRQLLFGQSYVTYIEIFETKEIRRKFRGSTEEFRLGVLLHEMVHCFLLNYSCKYRCCEPLNELAFGGAGNHGHGPVWADSMVTVHAIVRKSVDWLESSSIRRGVEKTMREHSFQPTQKQLDRWGLNPKTWGHIDDWDGLRLKFLARNSKDEVNVVVPSTPLPPQKSIRSS